eukprot:5290687-Karenia_brevis.AAC.1
MVNEIETKRSKNMSLFGAEIHQPSSTSIYQDSTRNAGGVEPLSEGEAPEMRRSFETVAAPVELSRQI